MGRESTDWALDHASALAKSLTELEMWVWYATDILLEADSVYRKYGPPPGPGDEVRGLLDSVRDYLLTVPHVDTDLHNHPMPPRIPGTSAEVVGHGEGVGPSVDPGTDVHVDDDISRAFDDLKTTDGDTA